MSSNDFDEIFGYQVYKPPPEKEMNIIEDLNFRGEVITLINAEDDVIQNEAVQQILQSLDGERTVKIEDLPPDVRYDGFNKKALFDATKVTHATKQSLIDPQKPKNKPTMFQVTSDQDAANHQRQAILQAAEKANNIQRNEKNMLEKLKGSRRDLEHNLKQKLVEALFVRSQMVDVTPQHQAKIEKLYLDLRLINPKLAMEVLTGEPEDIKYMAQTGGAEAHTKHRDTYNKQKYGY